MRKTRFANSVPGKSYMTHWDNIRTAIALSGIFFSVLSLPFLLLDLHTSTEL